MENRLYKKKYGAWAGNPEGHAPDFACCSVTVWPNERGALGHQCRKKRGFGPDAAYCKVHDPDAVKARTAAADRRYRDEQNRMQVQWHGRVFLNALQQIADGHNDPRSLAKEVIAEYERSLR